MIVKPKPDPYRPPGSVIINPSGDEPPWLVLECEVINPPSQRGRTVHFTVPPEQLADLMNAAKRMMILHRNKSLPPHVPQTG
jgi:hypothetical protein